jgi:Protein of unknown function (DUF1329)
MTRRGSLLAAVIVAVLPAIGRAQDPAVAAGDGDLKPGDVLNQANWQKAEGLLPPEILKHYRDGDYANPIVDWPADKFDWPPDFLEATKKNEGRFDIGAAGEVIDKATGEQPPYILGHPFPTIDPADPKAGVKVVWNFFYRTWYFGNLHADSQVNWVNLRALERRTDQNVNFAYYDGVPERERIDNPQNFSLQQLIVVEAPADLHGTAALTWRYRDPTKRDSAWSFVPALRRVRAISPSNRSDGFLGSDMAQDDGPFFDGKPEDFVWTLKGEKDQLRLVDPLNLAGKWDSIWLPSGGWRANWPEGLAMIGYMDPKWTGVGWAPLSGALAKRRFLVVDGVPKDKYYLFGRLELYIDKVTFQGAWNRKFSWREELLNSMQVMSFIPAPFKRPDGGVDYNQASNMAFQCAENIKGNQATVAGIKSSAKGGFDLRVKFDSNFFDMNSLSRYGK